MGWGGVKKGSTLTTHIPLGGLWLQADVHTYFSSSETLLTDGPRVCRLFQGHLVACTPTVPHLLVSVPFHSTLGFLLWSILCICYPQVVSLLSKEDKHMLDCVTASEHFCAKQVFILAIAHHTCEFKLVRIINKNFFRADQQASVENSYA